MLGMRPVVGLTVVAGLATVVFPSRASANRSVTSEAFGFCGGGVGVVLWTLDHIRSATWSARSLGERAEGAILRGDPLLFWFAKKSRIGLGIVCVGRIGRTRKLKMITCRLS